LIPLRNGKPGCPPPPWSLLPAGPPGTPQLACPALACLPVDCPPALNPPSPCCGNRPPRTVPNLLAKVATHLANPEITRFWARETALAADGNFRGSASGAGSGVALQHEKTPTTQQKNSLSPTYQTNRLDRPGEGAPTFFWHRRPGRQGRAPPLVFEPDLEYFHFGAAGPAGGSPPPEAAKVDRRRPEDAGALGLGFPPLVRTPRPRGSRFVGQLLAVPPPRGVPLRPAGNASPPRPVKPWVVAFRWWGWSPPANL